MTVGVSANGEKKTKNRKKRRRKRKICDDDKADSQQRPLTSSRSMSAFSSFISRTHSRRWNGRRGSADQQKSYMSNNGGVTTLRMNFSAAASASVDGSQNRAMSRTPASVL